MKLNRKEDTFTLYNGVNIPCIGYGTYLTPSDNEGLEAIKNAIEAGFYHIDCAAAYKNEHIVAQAIKDSGVSRDKIFITSKLWNENQGYESALEAFEESCKKLSTNYIDLYLIHWPIAVGHENDWQQRVKESWRAFEKLYKEGRVKAIGVSNFLIHHLEVLLESAEIIPMVNQLELHPKYQQKEIVEYCKEKNILLESWGPLMRGKAFDNPLLKEVADKYEKNVAQLLTRWCLQKEFLPLPKSMKKDRIISNSDVFDFEINDKDMDYIDSLNTNDSYVFHPDRNEEWQKKREEIYNEK